MKKFITALTTMLIIVLGFFISTPAFADTTNTSTAMIVDEAHALDVNKVVDEINRLDNPKGYKIAVLVSNAEQVKKDTWEADTRTYVTKKLGNTQIANDGKLLNNVILVVVYPEMRKIGVFTGDDVPINADVVNRAYGDMKPNAQKGDWNGTVITGASSTLKALKQGVGLPQPPPQPMSAHDKMVLRATGLGIVGTGAIGTGAFFAVRSINRRKEAERKAEAVKRAEEERQEHLAKVRAMPVPSDVDVKNYHDKYTALMERMRTSDDTRTKHQVQGYLSTLEEVLGDDWTPHQREDEDLRDRINNALRGKTSEEMERKVDIATFTGTEWRDIWLSACDETRAAIDGLAAEKGVFAKFGTTADASEFEKRMEGFEDRYEGIKQMVLDQKIGVANGKGKLNALQSDLKDYAKREANRLYKAGSTTLNESDYRSVVRNVHSHYNHGSSGYSEMSVFSYMMASQSAYQAQRAAEEAREAARHAEEERRRHDSSSFSSSSSFDSSSGSSGGGGDF